ncbi:MAG TPA: hypothetical protein PKV48_03510 [Thermodesulfobacteriota bacterium]|nr:hypothetical protein [Thermodesulfobacteriota bacterium]
MEKFIRKEQKAEPAVTIRKYGAISINNLAVKLFPLKECKLVTLHFDKKEKLIGIKPCNNPKEDSVFKVTRERGSTPAISCQAFLTSFGIQHTEASKVYPATWDEKAGMMMVKVE